MAAGLVVPFFRGPARLDLASRALFAHRLSDEAFVDGLRRSPAVLRVNVGRVLAAAALAHAEGRRLAFVEGWRANVIERPHGRPERVVTGSWLDALILRLLARRGLVSARLRPVRISVSRCTHDEARAAAALRADGELIGVTGTACPSAPRLARYLRDFAPAAALTPRAALARAGRVEPRLLAVVDATALRPGETAGALAAEVAAWATHLLSAIEARVVARPDAFEARLARRLRLDR
jgi:hypothetical protein